MHFNEFWATNLLKYEHIIYENSDVMLQDWEKNNQKFVMKISTSCLLNSMLFIKYFESDFLEKYSISV
jgi:hypothetical protein